MKKVAISQSNFLPWKGYFDLISSVDEFIFFDEMQFTKRDWRNRNLIKTASGTEWITVPVSVKGKYFQKISETEITGTNWKQKHLNKIYHNYRRSKYFEDIYPFIQSLYFNNEYKYLSELNQNTISAICTYLKIDTKITSSVDFSLEDERNLRLISICKQVGSTKYVSGPNAKSYICPKIFLENDIEIEWFNYDNFREYDQLWGPFCHKVSIIDVLFNCGPHSAKFIPSLKGQEI